MIEEQSASAPPEMSESPRCQVEGCPEFATYNFAVSISRRALGNATTVILDFCGDQPTDQIVQVVHVCNLHRDVMTVDLSGVSIGFDPESRHQD